MQRSFWSLLRFTLSQKRFGQHLPVRVKINIISLNLNLDLPFLCGIIYRPIIDWNGSQRHARLHHLSHEEPQNWNLPGGRRARWSPKSNPDEGSFGNSFSRWPDQSGWLWREALPVDVFGCFNLMIRIPLPLDESEITSECSPLTDVIWLRQLIYCSREHHDHRPILFYLITPILSPSLSCLTGGKRFGLGGFVNKLWSGHYSFEPVFRGPVWPFGWIFGFKLQWKDAIRAYVFKNKRVKLIPHNNGIIENELFWII